MQTSPPKFLLSVGTSHNRDVIRNITQEKVFYLEKGGTKNHPQNLWIHDDRLNDIIQHPESQQPFQINNNHHNLY